METLIRRRILRRLIWVSAFSHMSHKKDAIGLYGLMEYPELNCTLLSAFRGYSPEPPQLADVISSNILRTCQFIVKLITYAQRSKQNLGNYSQRIAAR